MKYSIPFALLSLAPASALAANCADLKSCAKVMNDLFSQSYVWDGNVDGLKFPSSPEIELTKQNGELVFTALLDQNGLARAPVGDGKTFRIVKSVSRREMETPIFPASFDHEPKLPETWDIVTMHYKLKSAETAGYIEQMYRLNLPRESRMQADNNSGNLFVTAPAPTVRHMYKMIKAADQPLTAAAKEQMRAHEKTRQSRMAITPMSVAPPAAEKK